MAIFGETHVWCQLDLWEVCGVDVDESQEEVGVVFHGGLLSGMLTPEVLWRDLELHGEVVSEDLGVRGVGLAFQFVGGGDVGAECAVNGLDLGLDEGLEIGAGMVVPFHEVIHRNW